MRGSVLPDCSPKGALLTAFTKVTYVETTMSMGVLYVNSQPRKTKPKATRSKPNKRAGSGKARLKGISKITVIRYPNAKKNATEADTIKGTKMTDLTLVDLNMIFHRISFLSLT